jgi:hypothetical protein
MVLSNAGALAIEAKWTEPRYEAISRRLKRLPSKSRRHATFDEVEYLATQRRFTDGWIDLLRPHAASALTLDSFQDAIYQTVHRAASVCGTSRPPSLAYLHFSPSLGSLAVGAARTEDYVADLRHVHQLLGHPAGFPFFVVESNWSRPRPSTKLVSCRSGCRRPNPLCARLVLLASYSSLPSRMCIESAERERFPKLNHHRPLI